MMKKYTIGIDSGSRSVKIVLFNHEELKIIDSIVETTGINPPQVIQSVYDKILMNNGLDPNAIAHICATGYGRNLVSFADSVSSEIQCHSKGALFFNPLIRTLIDIGGQDSKMIQIGANQKVTDFVMNDKCAAGTGRFLEKTAMIFQTNMNELDKTGLEYDALIEISSVCVVFAESEIIGLISQGIKPANIIASVYQSICHRIRTMGSHLEINPQIAFVGGVARNKLMGLMLEKEFKQNIYIPENPVITGALGAALIAGEKYKK